MIAYSLYKRPPPPRGDLQQTPIADAIDVYVVGSCSKPADGHFLCGYSVVSLPADVHEAYALPFNSAQQAELMALARAGEIFEGQRVNIYTDSRYAFGVAHDFGMLWLQRGFVAADGKPIYNKCLVTRLLDAVTFPQHLAIIKVKGHNTDDSHERLGNDLADTHAKAAAAKGTMPPDYVLSCPLLAPDPATPPYLTYDIDISLMQQHATDEDRDYWSSEAVVPNTAGLLCTPDGRTALPACALPALVRHFHGVSHVGQRGVIGSIKSQFCINKTAQITKQILSTCLTCARTNVGRPGAQHQHLPQPQYPFQSLQIDFTHMPPQGSLKYLLVIVDQFSKWVEAFPTSRETADVVCQILCKEIIQRFGVPTSINSDRGPSFTSEITQKCAKALNINWSLHVPYHPQSSGVVERMNRTIKNKLTKAMTETGMKWVSLLPSVLSEIRMTPSASTLPSPLR